MALLGRVREYHRFKLKERREDLQNMEAQILRLDKTLSQSVDGEWVTRLCTIPGVALSTAWTLLAEWGSGRRVFVPATKKAPASG